MTFFTLTLFLSFSFLDTYTVDTVTYGHTVDTSRRQKRGRESWEKGTDITRRVR